MPTTEAPNTGHAATAADGYRLVAWLFLRLLGAVYVAAFSSLALQIAQR